MKIFLLFILVSGLASRSIVMAGAEYFPGDEPNKAEIQIAITGDFNNDEIVVCGDGKRFFSGKISTNWSTGVAKNLAIPFGSSEVRIRVELPDKNGKLEKAISMSDGRFIEIQFLRGHLEVSQTKTRPLRD